MPGTRSIYEEPSRLSRGLVVGLSVAVVAMAGWFAATVTFSQSTATESDADATSVLAPVAAPAGKAAASGPADATRPAPRSPSSVFDWPAFPSALPPPASQTALPLAPEAPATRDPGRLWPVATPAQESRSLRPPAGAAPEATAAIVDILAPPPPSRGAGKDAAAQPQRQTQRRPQQKPRADSDAAPQ